MLRFSAPWWLSSELCPGLHALKQEAARHGLQWNGRTSQLKALARAGWSDDNAQRARTSLDVHENPVYGTEDSEPVISLTAPRQRQPQRRSSLRKQQDAVQPSAQRDNTPHQPGEPALHVA